MVQIILKGAKMNEKRIVARLYIPHGSDNTNPKCNLSALVELSLYIPHGSDNTQKIARFAVSV